MAESRIKKSILNARVNLIFYFITLVISFFSRKIFLNTLGADFIGLTGTLGNILSFLNLIELGIGSSIGFVLYKPIYQENKESINDIISVLGYLYRIIGSIIIVVGIILSILLTLIFKTEIDICVVFFVYYSFLISSLFGYFFNYKYTLLCADQKNYMITAYFQSSNILKTIIQIILAYYTKNYYLWAIVELFFSIIYCFILNRKIKEIYPWLCTSYSKGKFKTKDYPIIIEKAKQLFVHRLATIGRYKIVPLLIYAFSSLSAVAYYANYTLITDKLNAVLTNILDSTGASVGNLIAEGDKDKILKIYWELTSVRFLLSGVLAFLLFHLIEPFITLWLGTEYIMGNSILAIILINMFILQVRGTNDQFIHGYGLFADTWAPILTFIMTIIVSIICGNYYGLFGVLLGDTISAVLIICIWKPMYLFSSGFNVPVYKYFIMLLKYLLLLIISWILADFVIKLMTINPFLNYLHWLSYAIIIAIIFTSIYGAFSFIFIKGLRDFIYHLLKINV